MVSELLPRALAPVIREALADTPVVCLVGPRQSGKTTLARQLEPGRLLISLDELDYRRVAQDDPDGFVAALPEVVAIAEIQKVPDLLPAIKLSVDRDRRPGRFLLTGSADLMQVPAVSESLAGRMEIATLLPLTEAEKERRPGGFLKAMLAGELQSDDLLPPLPEAPALPERLLAGGYPPVLGRSPARARQWQRSYLRRLIERDVRDVARVRNPFELARLLELLCVEPAATLNASRLAKALDLRWETVMHYLAVLERLGLAPDFTGHSIGADWAPKEAFMKKRKTERGRFSSRRKAEAVLRLLRGEDLDLLSRELKVTPSTLSGWRTAFLSAGQAGLKTRQSDGREEEVRSLKAMVGDLTMRLEVSREAVRRLKDGLPFR